MKTHAFGFIGVPKDQRPIRKWVASWKQGNFGIENCDGGRAGFSEKRSSHE
ncbi:MAG: hypothetical protein WCC08_24585 [Terrimicrobiaceae bacterium]